MRCSRSRRSVRPAIPYRTTASCLFRPEQRALSKRRQRASPTGSRVTPRRHSPTSPSRFRSAGVASSSPVRGLSFRRGGRRRTPPALGEASRLSHRRSLRAHHCLHVPRQGAQYVGMARGLYEREPEFRDCLDRCASVLQDKLGGDIRALLFPASEDTHESAERELAQTRWTQPCLFAIEMALAKLLASWGIKPTACVGHSVGEFAAACVAGVFTRRRADTRGRPRPIDAVRSSRQDACRGNGEGELSPMLGDGLSLAAVNGRSSCVVSGPDVAIAELERRLAERSIATKSLRTSHAFHSAMMDPIVDAFACVAAGVSLAAEDPRRVERHWDLAHCGRGDGSGVLGETSPADRALRRRGDPSWPERRLRPSRSVLAAPSPRSRHGRARRLR